MDVARPLVSVIVPVWNGGRTLRACLRSIVEQSLTDMEIIVVNDGSTDGTRAMMEEFAALDGRFRLIHQENAGVSAARNAALACCKGEYIRFVDSDDRLPPDSMQLLVDRARDHESDLVIGAYTEVLLGSREHRDLGQCEDTLDGDAFLARLEPLSNSFYYGVLWNKLFRGDVVRDHGLRFQPGMDWGEDFVFVMSYCAHVRRVSYTQQTVYQYHRNPRGAVVRQFLCCFTHPLASLKERLAMYDAYVALFRYRGQYERYRLKLWRYLFRITLRN